jgi:6-phosphogluconolactonase
METLVFTGNSRKGGISVAAINELGKLVFADPVLPEEGVAPLALHPNQRFLYGVVRTRSPHELVTFAIDGAAKTLRPVGAIPVPVDITYLTVDPAGLNILAASYGGGETLVYALAPTGQAQPFPLSRLHPERNPHGINCTADGRFVFVPALGHDQIVQFAFDAASGRLTPNSPAALPFPRNAGPRHLVFSPDRRHVYALMELSGDVATLALDAATGTLTQLGSAALLPPERALPPSSYTPPTNAPAGPNSPTPVVWAADIGVTPDGRFVYASERTNSTVSCFRRDVYSGRLDFAGVFDVDTQPRSFAIDPWGRYLIAAGEKTGTLGVFAIDAATGGLSLLDRQDIGVAPNWVTVMVC